MQLPRRKIDRPNIERANHRHKEAINFWRRELAKVDKDPKKKERLAAAQCVMCFEGSRIGGSACSSVQCGLCDEILHSGSTNVDCLCKECALKTGLCKACGCDLHLINRRSREIPEPTPTIDRSY